MFSFTPAFSQNLLIERIGIVGMSGTVGDGFQCLWCVLSGENVRVLVLQDKPQPDVEEV